ncbi:winged helix-turn-helix domain-containing protein [Paraburkholderia bryophila]|uniref:Transposase n=1 Tax=Paraburkholderia bryophila TaxID=420952 RepID=A0A329CU04_9BURK|nr:winged helix-turn-helix domain-containing protein [Paraburkholderia bryophila]RAS38313.1 transposase [Paraburkholderia bryophila]
MSRNPKLTPFASKRLRAAQLLAAGQSMDSVARTVDISVNTIRRYKAILDADGIEAFEKISVGGRRSALDDQARAWITKTVRGSPRRHGFDVDQWTNAKLQMVIERQFSVRFSIVYVRQLTIDLGVHDRMRSFKAPMQRAPGVLDDDALAWIAAAMRHSPRLHDFDADRWTTPRLTTIIERRFGVRYSRRYVWQIVTELGLAHLLTRMSN